MVEHVYKYVWYIFARTIIGDTPKPDLRFFPGRLGWTIFAQGTLRRFTQRPWFEHPTFQLRGGHSTTELDSSRKWTTWRKSRISIMNWSRLSADHDYERNRKNNGWKMTFMLAKHPNLQQPPLTCIVREQVPGWCLHWAQRRRRNKRWPGAFANIRVHGGDPCDWGGVSVKKEPQL